MNLKEIKEKIFPGQNFIDPPEDIIKNRPNTISALLEFREVFSNQKINFWLDYGTLLGAVRDNAIIPWDHDIDLGTIKDEEKYNQIIKASKILEKKGWSIHYFLDRGMINYRAKGALPISIHLYEIKGDKAQLNLTIPRNFRGNVYSYLWWLTATAKYNRKDVKARVIVETMADILNKAYPLPQRYWRRIISGSVMLIRGMPSKTILKLGNYIEKVSKNSTQYLKYEYDSSDFLTLDKYVFYGKEFLIPHNINNHLSCTYGENWNVPNPDYIDENDNLLLVKSKEEQEKETNKKLKIKV